MAPYYDDRSVYAAFVIVGLMIVFLTIAWLKTRQAPKSLMHDDDIPPLEPISPAVAWMLAKRSGLPSLQAKGPLALALSRMARIGFMTVERRGLGRNGQTVLVKSQRAIKRDSMFSEEKILGDALFEVQSKFVIDRIRYGRLATANEAFGSSLVEQCVGPLYLNNWRWAWIQSLVALVLCCLYGIFFTPNEETSWMAGLGFVVGGMVALLWLLGDYIGPRRLWGAVISLLILTVMHGVLTWCVINLWADSETINETLGQGLPIAPPLHPVFLVGAWLTGLCVIGWEWLRTLTPKGHAILSALLNEHALFKKGMPLPRRQVVDWGDTEQAKNIQGAVSHATKLDKESSDWEGVRTGIRFAVTDAYSSSGDSAYDGGSFEALDFDISSALGDLSFSNDGGDGGDGGGD